MPEYSAPGVFVEETSFRSKSIEGVSTSTTAFVGPTRFGPIGEIPELLTSFGDFERIYGGIGDVGGKVNYIAHAVMSYFAEGGARLYVTRAHPSLPAVVVAPDPFASPATAGNPAVAAAKVEVPGPAPAPGGAPAPAPAAKQVGYFQARFPGAALNGRITVTARATKSSATTARKGMDGSLFRVTAGGTTTFYTKRGDTFSAKPVADGAAAAPAFPASDEAPAGGGVAPAVELLTLSVAAADSDENVLGRYDDLGMHPDHQRYIGRMLALDMKSRADHLSTQLAFVAKSAAASIAFDLQEAFALEVDETAKVFTLALTGGSDPALTKTHYEEALALVEGIDDVSIVAAPGYTELDEAVSLSLIAHAEKDRAYRIAVLDVKQAQTPGQARDAKAKMDSKCAALYYPWVVVPNPGFDPNDGTSDAEVTLPPSGFVCGIYARSDIERGVFKAPANEVIRSALRFERLITTGEQALLNPIGVNCLRYFPGRGYRVWGARTTSSDPEWKHVNIRRYFNYLEHSIDRGTQWAVFEPNGERLWANVKETVTSFLHHEWVSGGLLGTNPAQAFFVRCDRSTITQNDLDSGRLICLIGVAVIKPAEFVIFRIGQKTADSK